MDYTQQKEELALPPDTVLHDSIRLLDVEEVNQNDIVYSGELMESCEEISVREFCPSKIVKREGLELVCPKQDSNFYEGLKQFEKIGQLLKTGVPHMPEVPDFWYENHTAYYAVKNSDGDSFRRNVPIPTAIYVQSLGIMLCDTYSKLHENGLYYGAISEKDITFSENGSVILEPHITTDGTVAEDLHCFTFFLRRLLSETAEVKENVKNRPALNILQEALQYHYENSDFLKSALMGVNGSGVPSKKTKNFKPFFVGACAVCLGLAVFGTVSSWKTASAKRIEPIKPEEIQPEIISVWIPLDKDMDEQQQQEMYQELAEGFEDEHQGFGVDISLYDATAFSEALNSMNGGTMPAVFMNTLDSRATEKACDLSSLEISIDNYYITDLKNFGNVVPLGCSVPVLYYNQHHWKTNNQMIASGELPPDTLYDVSATEFITKQSAYEPQDQLETFLSDGSHPLLGSTDILHKIEDDGINTGTVQMIPVTASSDICTLQYEYYCTVNKDCPENTQKAGMLWLQYLLTEKAQTILFVEHDGALPLHEKAVATAINTHQMLQGLGGLKFDSASLQEKR